MSLYDIAKYSLGVLSLIAGVLMFFLPKLFMKKKEREIEHAVKDVKKTGVILMIAGVALEIILIVSPIVAGTM